MTLSALGGEASVMELQRRHVCLLLFIPPPFPLSTPQSSPSSLSLLHFCISSFKESTFYSWIRKVNLYSSSSLFHPHPAFISLLYFHLFPSLSPLLSHYFLLLLSTLSSHNFLLFVTPFLLIPSFPLPFLSQFPPLLGSSFISPLPRPPPSLSPSDIV